MQIVLYKKVDIEVAIHQTFQVDLKTKRSAHLSHSQVANTINLVKSLQHLRDLNNIEVVLLSHGTILGTI